MRLAGVGCACSAHVVRVLCDYCLGYVGGIAGPPQKWGVKVGCRRHSVFGVSRGYLLTNQPKTLLHPTPHFSDIPASTLG